jgi:hypothetical protein
MSAFAQSWNGSIRCIFSVAIFFSEPFPAAQIVASHGAVSRRISLESDEKDFDRAARRSESSLFGSASPLPGRLDLAARSGLTAWRQLLVASLALARGGERRVEGQHPGRSCSRRFFYRPSNLLQIVGFPDEFVDWFLGSDDFLETVDVCAGEDELPTPQVRTVSKMMEETPVGLIGRRHVVHDDTRIMHPNKAREVEDAASEIVDVRGDDDQSRLLESDTEQLDHVIVCIEHRHHRGCIPHGGDHAARSVPLLSVRGFTAADPVDVLFAPEGNEPSRPQTSSGRQSRICAIAAVSLTLVAFTFRC